MAESMKNVKAALSGWPLILAWLAMLIFAFHSTTHMVGAGDTWVAMACGRHFINHGVDTVEPFSANSHKAGPTEEEIKSWPSWAQWITDKVGLDTVKYWHPTGWVNQNWLTHVIFYWLTHESPFADVDSFSYNGLVYWKIAIYILSVICVYYTGRLLGANPALSAVFACFAMFAGRSFFDIRPAGFSNLLVAVFLLILVLATYRNILYIWLIVPVTVFWCNAHGGYIYVFIMLVPFIGLHFLTSFVPRHFISIGLKGVVHSIAAGFVSFVASIVFNPFHLTNLTHTFVISVSEHAKMWRTVNEWHPAFAWKNPVGTGFPFLVLFILSICMIIFWLFSRLLVPKLTKAPKNELNAQEKLFRILSRIFGWSLGMLLWWVVFISFSFCHADLADLFICILFVGLIFLSIRKDIYFIFLLVPLTVIVLWLSKDSSGYSGRYIYPFIILPVYVISHIIFSLFSREARFTHSDIIFVIVSSLGAVVLMTAIFNPFKFESLSWNLIAYLKQFFTISRPWKSRYETNLGNLGEVYRYLFAGLLILNVILAVVWFFIPYFKRAVYRKSTEVEQPSGENKYELPRIDLAFIVVAALTIYMAYRSRRFIPIAAMAACPLLAMLIDQICRTVSASYNFYRKKTLTVPVMPCGVQVFFTCLGVVAVLGFGLYWGLKFKYVYLDPWPGSTELNSVFIRMTASDVKPFYVSRFIRENKLKGKMFNYWTEGGFIAYGQDPDVETGKTPLQLFMDGRAQAAYDPEAYKRWSEIMAGTFEGGRILQSAKVRGRKLNTSDYKNIGKEISKELRKNNVWVVLMPVTGQVATGPFLKSLGYNSEWPLVFLNDSQKLFVDIKTPQGRKLAEGVLNGETVYPDEFSRNLIIANHLLKFGIEEEAKKKGLDYAMKAFSLKASTAAVKEIMDARRFPVLRPQIIKFCKNYFADFAKNKKDYAKKHGYDKRLVAALIAGDYLQQVERANKKMDVAKSYADKVEKYNKERISMIGTKRW